MSPFALPAIFRRKWLLWGLGGLVVLLLATEGIARAMFGLGNPPLLMADAQVEYLFRPSASYVRFGRRISFNRFSMRSPDFSEKRESADELRILILGDSIVNGGAPTDQRALATELLREALRRRLNRPVVTGNISAGSWGPANVLAYVQRYGWFDATAAAWVVSNHDICDVPTYQPLPESDPNFPTRRPSLAVAEAWERYLLPRLRPAVAPGPEDDCDADAERAVRLAAVKLAELAEKSGVKLAIVYFPGASETMETNPRGKRAFHAIAKSFELPFVDLTSAFENSKAKGVTAFRDIQHPNEAGQRILAEALELLFAS